VPQQLLPMSDHRVTTMVTLRDGGIEVPFQEYFVQRQHSVPVTAVRFDGANQASLTVAAMAAFRDSEVVVIAPSNPLVSIAPIRALHGVDAVLAARRDSVVAISPIVGGAALKGPADRMLEELGHEASVVGVARLYADIAATLVIDPVDAHLVAAIEHAGMRVVVTPSVMSTADIGHELARQTLDAAR
ncbi:MAG TPA: 2-phospho-L-lactate transferase CofD family protein, partial [Ilumatobacteraceae bacterium]|nr:2-phospho-L-lactate transferase CofD family protein [Ilumatobacteraceae bacterium]